MILNVDIDPHKVDVNVHPAKLEVRFENESEVFKLVYHAIKESLLKCDFLGQNQDAKNENSNFGNLQDESKSYSGFLKNIIHNQKVDKKEDYESHNNIIEELYNEKSGITEVQNLYSENKNSNASEVINNTDANDIQEIDEQEEKSPIDEVEEQIRLMLNKDAKVQTDISDNLKQAKMEKDNFEKLEKIDKVTEIQDVIDDNKKIDDIEGLQKDTQNVKEHSNKEAQNSFEEMYIKTFGRKPKEIKEVEEKSEEYVLDEIAQTTENISLFKNPAVLSRPTYKIIGVAFYTYIILQIDDEMYILDQHAAHERILYERVKKNYYNNSGKDSQLMLLPDIINLTHKEMGILKDNINLFEKAGFVLEEFGDNTIKLTGVPNICIDLDTKELFLETLDEINTVARTAKQEIEEKFIATVACKAAVKANMALSTQEIDSLLQELLLLPNPFTCPHGRPTAIKMSKTEIEKKFSRR